MYKKLYQFISQKVENYSFVRFIRRQVNEVVYCLTKMTMCHTSFRIHIRILSYIPLLLL